MAIQTISTRLALLAATLADNGEPTNITTDGIAVTDPKTSLYSLEIVVTGTDALTFEGYLWGVETQGAVWSRLGSGGSAGNINGSGAITGTGGIEWRDVVANLGYLERVYLEILNLAGTDFSLTSTLTPISEDK